MKSNFYKKKILVTGHNGFKGKWLSIWLSKLGADVLGVSLSKNKEDKLIFNKDNNIKSIYQDICHYEKVSKILKKFNPHIIFHLAAQSIVQESYINPIKTYKTNVLGTLNIFEASNHCSNLKAIINVTSDKCYLNQEKKNQFKETDFLGGDDIYSSSKACSEILTNSYRKSFLNFDKINKKNKILLSSVRCGNVIGGGDQNKFRILPDIIRSIRLNKSLEVRNPNSVRPWIYILDCLNGYLTVGRKLLLNQSKFAQAYNFGPITKKKIKVKDLIELFVKNWKKIRIKHAKEKKFNENKFLFLDTKKARKELNWKPFYSTEEAITEIIDWYKDDKTKIIKKYEIAIEKYSKKFIKKNNFN